MPVYIIIVLTVAENISSCWEERVTHATNTVDLQHGQEGKVGIVTCQKTFIISLNAFPHVFLACCIRRTLVKLYQCMWKGISCIFVNMLSEVEKKAFIVMIVHKHKAMQEKSQFFFQHSQLTEVHFTSFLTGKKAKVLHYCKHYDNMPIMPGDMIYCCPWVYLQSIFTSILSSILTCVIVMTLCLSLPHHGNNHMIKLRITCRRG